MIFAIMKDNIVVNTIVAEQDFIDEVYPGSIDITDLEFRPSTGWTYNNGEWVAPEPSTTDNPA